MIARIDRPKSAKGGASETKVWGRKAKDMMINISFRRISDFLYSMPDNSLPTTVFMRWGFLHLATPDNSLFIIGTLFTVEGE